jgi:hypothetical protein
LKAVKRKSAGTHIQASRRTGLMRRSAATPASRSSKETGMSVEKKIQLNSKRKYDLFNLCCKPIEIYHEPREMS